MINFFRKIGFTKSEVLLLSALIFIFISGLLIDKLSWKPSAVLNYSRSDSVFNSKVKKLFQNLDKDSLTNLQKQNTQKLEKLNDSLLIIAENKTSNSNKPALLKTKINLNTALTADLILLPGVGEVTAEKIIEYREKTGGFKSIHQIKEIKGIGEKKFEKIKDYITVE
jgi:comEA protein